MIRVSIVDADRVAREGLMKLLRHAPGIVCLGAYADADEAEREIPQLLPNVVLMDIKLPEGSGIDCLEKLKSAVPQLEVLILTADDNTETIFNTLSAGASGYLLKRSTADDIIVAIRDVHAGGAPMSLQIARKVVLHFRRIKKPQTDVQKLTKREQETLALLAQGMPYKQIATQLGISTSTVHGHLHAIYEKLHVQSRTEAVLKFLGR